MGPKVIVDWKARRSGAGMTITGKEAADRASIVVTNVVLIEIDRGMVIATDGDLNQYELRADPDTW